jgi:lysophospholipase L1-like esterase
MKFRTATMLAAVSAPSWPGMNSSWPGLARPSTSLQHQTKQDVDARHKAGHDGSAAFIAALAAALYLLAGAAWAAEPCDIPASLLSGGYDLKHVAAAVKDKRLTVAVVGTGSSLLAGPDGPRSAYPARLEEALKHKLPGIDVKVVSLARSRMTAEDLARGMDKMLSDEKPELVIWQTGTLDAIRRVDPDDFRAALDEGVETLHKGGVDVILMNMQYSPRTDIMVPLGPYADNMRVVAQQHEIPLFDRLAIMRNWSDTGAFDLYAAGKDNVLAQRVHDCIARGIAAMIVDAAHLRPESKAAE